MVIAPSSYIDEAHAFTEANLFANGACYYWTADNVVNGMGTNPATNPVLGNTLAPESAHIWHVTPSKTVSESTVTFTGYIVNFVNSGVELTREYVCRGYVAVTDESGTKYTLADYDGGKQENNTRSMTYVAQLACEDTSGKVTDAQKETLKKGYIETAAKAEITTTYTVNHHKVVGSEKITETETKEGFVGTDVGDFAKEYEGFILNEKYAGSKTSGSVYPDGRLVLDYYYEKTGLHFADGIDQVTNTPAGTFTYVTDEHAPDQNGAAKLVLSASGEADLDVTPNGTQKDEIHVWVKNDSANDVAFALNWGVNPKVYNADGVEQGALAAGGALLPANSGWLRLVYAINIKFTQINIWSGQEGNTLYIGDIIYVTKQVEESDATLDFTKNVDQLAGVPSSLTCSYSTEENALKIEVAGNGDIDVTPNGEVEYTEVHVWVKNTTDKRLAFYVDWKTTSSAIGGSVTGGNLDGGYVVPANSGWIELVYTATGMTFTQLNVIAFDGVPTTGALYVSKVQLSNGEETPEEPEENNAVLDFTANAEQVAGSTSGVAYSHSTAENALKIEVSADGDVNVTPNEVTEYKEVHVWVKNTTDVRLAFYVDWKTTSSAIGDSVTGGNLEGGYVVPANSGWIELVYTATGMTFTQLNVIAFDGVPTTGALYISKVEYK